VLFRQVKHSRQVETTSTMYIYSVCLLKVAHSKCTHMCASSVLALSQLPFVYNVGAGCCAAYLKDSRLCILAYQVAGPSCRQSSLLFLVRSILT
jgi:hypothetical protein